MALKLTNLTGINLSLAVWLAHDDYDYVDEENYISVTTLMRPLKQIILAARVPAEQKVNDVGSFIASSLGTAIHDSIEKAWTQGHKAAMRKLGYPDHIIDRIRINPTSQELIDNPEIIPIYLEQRSTRKINGFTIGGKFDMVAEGIVQDNKSTSVWGFIKGTKEEDHKKQGSLYRWLNVDKITEDYILINYIFTDWAKGDVERIAGYPKSRLETIQIPLWSVPETENWIIRKTNLLKEYWDAPESEIPECTDEELWRGESQYKYYSDPTKTDGRSTRNFDSLVEAQTFMSSKGGKGVVKTIPGEVKACGYCPAAPVCKQREQYL